MIPKLLSSPGWSRRTRAAALGCLAGTAAAAPVDFDREVLPILDRYCLSCHGHVDTEADLNLERFLSAADALAERHAWGKVEEKILTHQMPPPKREAQPTAAERETLARFVAELAAQPDPVLGARDPGQPVLRRLTRLEYNNALRDLFGLEGDIVSFPERLPLRTRDFYRPWEGRLPDDLMITWHMLGNPEPPLLPRAGLPGDHRARHGYRNRGDAANFSPLLLERYLEFARDFVASPELPRRSPRFAALLGLPWTPPAEPPARADARVGRLVAELPASLAGPWSEAAPSAVSAAAFATRAVVSGGGWLEFADSVGQTEERPAGGALAAPLPGGRNLVLTHAEPLTIHQGTGLVSKAENGMLRFQVRPSGLRPDEGIEVIGLYVQVPPEAKGQLAVGFRQKSDFRDFRVDFPIDPRAGGRVFVAIAVAPGEGIHAFRLIPDEQWGSQVRLTGLGVVVGLRPDSPARPARRAEPVIAAALADYEIAASQTPAERFERFLTLALRRPPQREEFDRYFAFYARERKAGASEADATREAVAAVLASPGFLFFAEPLDPGAGSVRALSGHEVAARLASFLWTSVPDEELLAFAATGGMRDPAAVRGAVQRLLRDPRSLEFVESFAPQWLRLDQLLSTKPDNELFQEFYWGRHGGHTLHAAQFTEALLLFLTVLVENRSVLDFVAADSTWLNPQLADLYDVPWDGRVPAALETDADNPHRVTEISRPTTTPNNHWRRVRLARGERGGYLTMSAPLTVTSLPFRTSPVKRGAWVLETIFNRPPSEPKIAFVIENDTKEAAQASSVREKFEAHRNQAACFSCHIRLDPPGFALERFDPIGRWRESDGGAPVDARGEWNGREFDGPAAFKAELLANPEEFVRGFVEHLLAYALGRELGIHDRPAVDEILAATKAGGYRLQDLLAEVVLSYPFRHTRNVPAPPAASDAAFAP